MLVQNLSLIEEGGNILYAQPTGQNRSSTGAHIRHILDHVDAFLAGLENGIIDYDVRIRGSSLETNTGEAAAKIQRQAERLLQITDNLEKKFIQVRVLTRFDNDFSEYLSTIGREIAFLINHTVHHEAIIRQEFESAGREVPEFYGYAPSTVAHRKSLQTSPAV